MRIPPRILLLLLIATHPAAAQALFKCTDSDGDVTYQQTACPATTTEKKIDATPANPDVDPDARERLLRQGADADLRMKERAAQDKAERLEREAREREQEREKRAEEERARRKQEAAEYAIYVYPPYAWLPQRPPYGYPQPRSSGGLRLPVPMPRGH